MGIYTKSAQASEELVHSDWAYSEFGKLQTALDSAQDYKYANLYIGDLGNSVANTTIQKVVTIPEACTLVAVNAGATAVTGTTKPTVDIFDENAGTPATILDAAKTIAAAKTDYTCAIKTTEVTRTAGNRLGVRCTTAADGTATALSVTLVLKKTLGT